MTKAAFLRGIQLDNKAIYESLFRIASNALINKKIITKGNVLKELRIHPQRGAIKQPSLVLKDELIFQYKLKEKIEERIKRMKKPLLFLIGRPGAGKSWFLESWQELRKNNPTPIFYCFRGLDDKERNKRKIGLDLSCSLENSEKQGRWSYSK